MISALAGQAQWAKEYHGATPEERVLTAKKLNDQVSITPNGPLILSEIIADAEAAKRRYRLEAETFRASRSQMHPDSNLMVEAAS